MANILISKKHTFICRRKEHCVGSKKIQCYLYFQLNSKTCLQFRCLIAIRWWQNHIEDQVVAVGNVDVAVNNTITVWKNKNLRKLLPMPDRSRHFLESRIIVDPCLNYKFSKQMKSNRTIFGNVFKLLQIIYGYFNGRFAINAADIYRSTSTLVATPDI